MTNFKRAGVWLTEKTKSLTHGYQPSSEPSWISVSLRIHANDSSPKAQNHETHNSVASHRERSHPNRCSQLCCWTRFPDAAGCTFLKVPLSNLDKA